MAKNFVKLYFGIFFALVIVVAFKIMSDSGGGGFSEAISNLNDRLGIVLVVFFGVPLVLAVILTAFQKLLSKFQSK